MPRGVGRLLTDIRPLQVSLDYRRLWIGNTVSQLGQQMTAVTIAIQVYALTRSTFAVGLVGLFALVPLIGFGLYGGAVADAIDRRKLALVASVGLWSLSLVLVVQAVLHLESVWLLYVVVAAQSGCFAVNNPTRASIIPRLIPKEYLPAANALNMASFNLGFTVGPLLGAVAISAAGYSFAYGIDAVTFTAALYALFRLPPIPPQPLEGGVLQRPGLRSVVEGFRFLRNARNLRMTFILDLCAMVLAQPRALFPAVAGGFFGGGVRTVGLLQAAPAIGSLLAFTFSGWVGKVRRQGLAIAVCVIVYGASVAAFGFARALWVGVLLPRDERCGRHGQRGVPLDDPAGRRPRQPARPAPGRLHRRRRRRPSDGRLRRRLDGCVDHTDDRVGGGWVGVYRRSADRVRPGAVLRSVRRSPTPALGTTTHGSRDRNSRFKGPQLTVQRGVRRSRRGRWRSRHARPGRPGPRRHRRERSR